MGTSGARKGYKVFSINTTIRNPKRNFDFLTVFKSFDGEIMDDFKLYSYYFELVRKGIYKFSNIPQSVKSKLENGEELTVEEVKLGIDANPQKTGLSGRVMTQLRALKDQGFLIFEDAPDRKYKISISALGNELIENKIEAPIIYTKALIGMQANNPCRTNLLNKSVPFLNTLFVIDEVNRQWKELGNEPKGILKHEFATFVLSMKDCDYKKAANEIIKYREKNRYEVNKIYIENYLRDNGILPLAISSITYDYPDDVFRKFEMTGLIVQHGKFNYTYYTFSKYNIEKVNAILDLYKDYRYIHFDSQQDYYDHMASIVIPWETDEKIRQKIVDSKAEVLNIKLGDNITLKEKEELLDRTFYTNALSKAVDKYDLDLINNELLILAGTNKGKSKFDSIAEPLRLEYLLALSMGKRYGIKGLVSNIIYSEDGLPLHCAPASKADIIYHHQDGSYILEPTMQRSRSQQLNNETTNIVRHVKEQEKKDNTSYRVSMIAPSVHTDVADYYQYQADAKSVKITTLSIERVVGLFDESKTVKELNNNFDKLVDDLINLQPEEFAEKVNTYRFCK